MGRLTNRHLPRRARRNIEASRRRLLRELHGYDDVTFIQLRGNRGDELIWAGARAMLRDVDYREVHPDRLQRTSGQLALLAGCGGWCADFHGFAPDVLQQVEKRFEHVVVLPSTFEPSYGPVGDVLRASRARLFARDRVSYELVAPFADVGLAHDTAFFFDYTPYLRHGRGVLTAMRTDHASVADWDALGLDQADNVDISRTARTLDEWLWWIARHRHVRTDRAHVMIAAAMLGKSVTYHVTTDHKVSGIAAYGMDGLGVRNGDLERAAGSDDGETGVGLHSGTQE